MSSTKLGFHRRARGARGGRSGEILGRGKRESIGMIHRFGGTLTYIAHLSQLEKTSCAIV